MLGPTWSEAVVRMQSAGVSDMRLGASEVAFEVGAVSVRVAPHGAGVRSTLRWPDLGIGLRIAERLPNDPATHLPGLDADLRARFAFEARSHVHLAHFVDLALGHALAAFDRALLDDAGATGEELVLPGHTTGVERALYRAYELAKRVYASRERVLPTLELVAPPSSRVPPYR